MPKTQPSHFPFLKFFNRRRATRVVCQYTAFVLLASMLPLSVPAQVLATVMRDSLKISTAVATRTEARFTDWLGSHPWSRAQERDAPPAPSDDRGVPTRPAFSKEESEARTASIQINPSGAVVLQSRQPMLFAAIPADSEGTAVHGLYAEWESSDEKVVFISKDGQALGGNPGDAILTAKVGRISENVSVTVVEGTKEDFGGKKKEDSKRQPGQIGLNRYDNKRVEVAQKTSVKRQHAPTSRFSKKATFANAGVARLLLPMRDPTEDPLPDDETGSLYQPTNNTGTPPGRTRPGGSTPPVATAGIETGNKNFSFGLPIVSLPGRGLDVSLGLTYNSLLYNKSTDPGNSSTWLTYDVDSGWPAQGFRLGYGQIEDQGSYGFTLTDADGTRHALTYTSATNYDSTDGTFIHFNGGSGWGTLYYTDGTRVTYGAAGGGYRSYPTKITDRNGNYILISYVNGVGPKISSVQDTLGRYVRFYYATNGDLVTITAPGLTGQSDRQVMRFYYDDMTFNASSLFSSGVNVSMPTSAHVIKYIFLPNSVEAGNAHIGYRFDYSSYGMIYQTAQFRGMTVSSTSTSSTGSVSSEGTQAAVSTYDYPGTPINSTTGLSDVPTYTTRTDDWAGRTTGMGGNFSTAPYYTFSVIESTGVSTVTAPDGAVSETHAVVNSGQWNDGLISETFIDKQGSAALSHSVIDWEQGASGSPRVTQARITNDSAQTKASVFSYTTSYNNVASVSERDFTTDGSVSTTELRRTETTYITSSSYTNRYLIHLPSTVKVFPGGSSTAIARVDYAYDDYGTSHAKLTSRADIVMHDPAFDPFAPNSYDPATDYRGNVTGVTTYPDASSTSNTITHSTTYDIAGNVMTAEVDCCQLKTLSYTDSPNTHTYAYPTSVTSGDPSGLHLTSSMTYDFNTGVAGTATDENGQVTTNYYYSDSLRLDHVVSPDGGAAYLTYSDTLEADANGKYHYYVQTQTKLDAPGGTPRYITSRRYFDGRGAVARAFDNYTSADGYSTQDIEYDVMGRAYRTSNPYFAAGYSTAINSSGFWSSSTFDDLGRVTQITMPRGDEDNSLTTNAQSSYDGVFTTVTDQAGKQRRQKVDALGRVIRLDEPDSTGSLGTTASPAQATSYAYDALDNLAQITQGAQNRYFKYDSLSRMIRERQVEQATNSSYNLSDSLTGNSAWSRKMDYNLSGLVTDGYDARGVHTQFSYDDLNRVTAITYSDSTATRHYYYDSQTLPSGAPSYTHGSATGRLIAMTYGSGATGTYFGYDSMGRANIQKQVTGSTPTTYSLSYGYNLAGMLTGETYPSGRALSHAYDEGGRLSSVSDGTTTFANAFTYVAHGGLKSETWGNGAVHSLSYNRRLQPSEVKLKQSSTGSELQRYNYSYGQVTQSSGSIDTSKNNGQIGRIDGFINGAATKEWDQRFVYDELGRLSIAAEYQQGNNSNKTWQTQYTYDRWGNRFQSGSGNSGVGYTPVVTSEIDAATNRFIASGSTPTTYDAAGNITTDTKFRGLSYAYDANGRQTSASNGTWTETQVYDCAGQRVQTTVNSVTRTMVYDIFGQQVADYSGASLQRENIYRGGQLLSVIETPTSAAPSNLTAVPSGGDTSIALSWTAASGATNYRVERKAAGTSYVLAATTTSTSLTDSGVSSGSAYLYKVCAADGSGNCLSAYSNVALGTAVNFTDDPLTIGVTAVKAQHVTELRSAVNAVRSLAGLSAATWTNTTLTAGVTVISAADVSDLRTKLDEALVALAIQTSSYTDPTLATGANGTPIKKAHIAEPRQRATIGAGNSSSGGSAGGVQYVLSDVQGSSRAVMSNGTYGSSAIIARHDYLPFGQELGSGTGLRSGSQGYGASDTNRRKYGLTERDDVSGLDHTWWRKYENSSGRWTSPDPYGSMSIANPQSFNRYAYVNNDPVNFDDPSGLNSAAPEYDVIRVFTWDWGYGFSAEYGFVSGGSGGRNQPGDPGGGGGGGGRQNPDENGIRDGLKRALSDPDCSAIVNDLMNAVATKKNPLVEQYTQGGIMALFESVVSGKGGMTRVPVPGGAGYGSPSGLIAKGNAGFFMPLRPFGPADQLRADTKVALGELMHLGGKNDHYSDWVFADVVHRKYPGLTPQMWPGDPNYKHYKEAKNNPNSVEWSYYWHQAVDAKCFK